MEKKITDFLVSLETVLTFVDTSRSPIVKPHDSTADNKKSTIY